MLDKTIEEILTYYIYKVDKGNEMERIQKQNQLYKK